MINKFTIKALFALLIVAGLFASCQKESYFKDSGVHNPKYAGSILSYLKSKPAYFDTLNRVIKIAGMETYFDQGNDITFFAPTSSAIYKSIKGLNRYLQSNGRDTVSKLEQIKPEAWKNLLSLYVFEGTNHLKDYPQIDTLNMAAYPGQGYTSLNGRTMNIGVLYNDASSGGSTVKYAGYRQLYLAYIPNYTDPRVGLKYAPVATSDIAPKNGIIHVLVQDANFGGVWKSKHNFGFETSIFINTVQSFGILPPTP
jgi:uncharacterized surface protein with fasciclin (FAS1) repeats